MTQEQLDAETDRAMRAQRAPAAPHCGRPDIPRLRHELQRLADAMRIQRVDPKAWARRLQDRERRGERLASGARGLARRPGSAVSACRRPRVRRRRRAGRRDRLG
ncbi:hypothetical protein ABXN37_19785 [Piscinibacter sakaiensis]|uniref:hypothetical protein n=1 Tax=Piscinibacter sakaiensis TaxID=1547922 RepID=UPI00372C9FFA